MTNFSKISAIVLNNHFKTIIDSLILQILELIFPYFLNAVYIKFYYKLRFTLIMYFSGDMISIITVYLAIKSPTSKTISI